MEIIINLDKLGYAAGRLTGRIVRSTAVIKIASSGFGFVSKIAKDHKIDHSNPVVVSDNIFKCLKYID